MDLLMWYFFSLKILEDVNVVSLLILVELVFVDF